LPRYQEKSQNLSHFESKTPHINPQNKKVKKEELIVPARRGDTIHKSLTAPRFTVREKNCKGGPDPT